MKDLSGANAIVTGASRGLGAHISRTLAARGGVNLALAARSAPELEALAQELGGRVRVVAIPTDVTSEADRQRLFQRAQAEVGPIDLLVNNAGIEVAAPFTELTAAEIEEMISVNLTSVLLITRLVLPGMLERRRGHVVNVASLAGKVGVPFDSVYSTTKFGLVGLTHSLRSEHSDSPVGFSAVCPGFVRGDGMYARWDADGYRAPRLVGTTSLDKVGRAVIRAIVRDRAEVLVNDVPMRELLVLMAALPQLTSRLMSLVGARRMFKRVAEANHDR